MARSGWLSVDCLMILSASSCDVGGFICPKLPHVTHFYLQFLTAGSLCLPIYLYRTGPQTPEAMALSCAMLLLCLNTDHIQEGVSN